MTSTEANLRQRKATESEPDIAEKSPEEPKSETRATPAGPPFDFVFLVVTTVVVCFLIYHFNLLNDPRGKLLTKEQLAEYNGVDGSPLYIAILGEVYDVTKGEKYYGKDKGYYCFVGRDATRAFASGEFVKDLTDDVADFGAEKQGGLVTWRTFFRDHQEYTYIGRVIGAFYDESGQPTEALKAVEEGAVKADEITRLQEEAKKRNPNCNSRWAQGKGGEVWCKEGYPRIVVEYYPEAEPKKRCACFLETDHSIHKQLYENCAPDATRCEVAPKSDKKT